MANLLALPTEEGFDTSVSLKWAFNDEEAVEQAVALRDAAVTGALKLVVPSLWLYEVTNWLVVAVRRGRLTAEDGSGALRHLMGIGIKLADPEADDAYQDSIRRGVAAYDAAYLTLAETLGVPMWTGDRRFYAAMRSTTAFVRWIGNY